MLILAMLASVPTARAYASPAPASPIDRVNRSISRNGSLAIRSDPDLPFPAHWLASLPLSAQFAALEQTLSIRYKATFTLDMHSYKRSPCLPNTAAA